MTIQIGTQIKQARRRLLLTQAEMATKAGVALSTVCKAESDGSISFKTARKIARALDLDLTAAAVAA